MSRQPPLLNSAPQARPSQPAVRRWLDRLGLGFAPDVEAAFQQEMDRKRRRRAKLGALAALILYGLFAISGRIMLADVYPQAWTIHFLVGMPVIALCAFAMQWLHRPAVTDVLLPAAIVTVAASIVWLASLSELEPAAASYQSALSLVVLFGNIVLNLRFRGALASSMMIAAIYAAALISMESLAVEPRLNNWLLFAATAMISLVANFRMNQDQRRVYLAAISEKERNNELSHAVELLGRLSAEDALTEVANRREFDRRLAIEWGRARRETQPLAMILADVDFFKAYNDHYGHPAGDACLQQIAAILRAIPQRSTDLAARLGGEEFGVLLPATSIGDAERLAESMREAVLELNLPHAHSSAAPVISASFGVAAMLPTAQDEPAQLFANADAALYSAKNNGRNRTVIYKG
jgi:diguanylate cyclase (GGDEF)-like protein